MVITGDHCAALVELHRKDKATQRRIRRPPDKVEDGSNCFFVAPPPPFPYHRHLKDDGWQCDTVLLLSASKCNLMSCSPLLDTATVSFLKPKRHEPVIKEITSSHSIRAS